MKPHIKVDITVGTLLNMNAEQLEALQKNIIGDGRWETADELTIHGGDYLGVVPKSQGRELLFIGVEKDGYTHS